MIKKDKNIRKNVDTLYQFRSKIPANLTVKKVNDVWGVDIKKSDYKELIEPRINVIEKKLNISKNLLDKIVISPFVKFVGVSGSVASEFAKKEDDIDLFIVVKNDTVWIYRLLLYIRNYSKNIIRAKGNQAVKDKLCINYLVEERGLEFEPDIFNLNELIYLKPIYNKNYLYVIFLLNNWLKEKYFITNKFLGKDKLKVGDVKNVMKRNYLLIPINFIAFILQLIFMLVTKHEPDIERLFRGFKEGKVQFYPRDFRKKKLEDIKSH
jgi:hypothetical protein